MALILETKSVLAACATSSIFLELRLSQTSISLRLEDFWKVQSLNVSSAVLLFHMYLIERPTTIRDVLESLRCWCSRRRSKTTTYSVPSSVVTLNLAPGTNRRRSLLEISYSLLGLPTVAACHKKRSWQHVRKGRDDQNNPQEKVVATKTTRKKRSWQHVRKGRRKRLGSIPKQLWGRWSCRQMNCQAGRRTFDQHLCCGGWQHKVSAWRRTLKRPRKKQWLVIDWLSALVRVMQPVRVKSQSLTLLLEHLLNEPSLTDSKFDQ